MDTFNIKKTKTTRYSSIQKHNSYGIQKWLVTKGFCLKQKSKYKLDENKYKDLLIDFIKSTQSNYNFKKYKTITSYETFVQKRFNKFCNYVIKKENSKPFSYIWWKNVGRRALGEFNNDACKIYYYHLAEFCLYRANLKKNKYGKV